MKTVLVLGAGRSSHYLINYLFECSAAHGWQIIVGDKVKSIAESAVEQFSHGRAVQFDIHEESAKEAISSADVVISLLPPALHVPVGELCLAAGRHLLTASYVSDEMKKLDAEAKAKHLLFLNECGLDPGIDHMSAMKLIDEIKSEGGKIISFESFTGGLIAPETDPENPWRYKFTWNPRNVVTAGQSGAEYLKDGKRIHLSYTELFREITSVTVPGNGEFEGYANRDSLKYLETYALQSVTTMIRGTLRSKGFCSAWDVLVQMGCCDDTRVINYDEGMTNAAFMNLFIKSKNQKSIEDKLMHAFDASPGDIALLRWSGFLDNEPIGLREGTPAQVTEQILMNKWKLRPADKDMIVMWHRFVFEQNGVQNEIQSSLMVKGEDEKRTAMAKTVGLPLGMAARLLLEDKISARGVCIPVYKEFYTPVLNELKGYGIEFREKRLGK
ncbi:MAG TPA: saccharopine dehydrogenase C-terminal domain-containing protein [Cyclobacteriaceae bacterium]|nr:saccharopine dehydrogenase C-terminal domain-containing protein [Cyclobacteriaceae bacterium]